MELDDLLETSEFRHTIQVTVRFNEVDMLGVCNNAVYIQYFEHARLEYTKDCGLMPEGGIFTDGKHFYMVRNEINYRAHAKYGDKLNIYTRITFMKNSSYGFDHIIKNCETGKTIVDGKGVVVQVDPVTGKSIPLDENFRAKVNEYEICKKK